MKVGFFLRQTKKSLIDNFKLGALEHLLSNTSIHATQGIGAFINDVTKPEGGSGPHKDIIFLLYLPDEKTLLFNQTDKKNQARGEDHYRLDPSCLNKKTKI